MNLKHALHRPWRIDNCGDANEYFIETADGLYIAQVSSDLSHYGEDTILADEEAHANAEVIIRAVNNHENLVAVLKNLVKRNLIKDKDGDHYQEVLEAIGQAEK